MTWGERGVAASRPTTTTYSCDGTLCVGCYPAQNVRIRQDAGARAIRGAWARHLRLGGREFSPINNTDPGSRESNRIVA